MVFSKFFVNLKLLGRQVSRTEGLKKIDSIAGVSVPSGHTQEFYLRILFPLQLLQTAPVPSNSHLPKQSKGHP